MTGSDARRPRRLVAGLVACVAGLVLIGSTFLGWLTTGMVSGGRTAISGWGMISGGGPGADGTNVNDLVAGLADSTYQPGLAAALLGAVAIVLGLIIAVTPRRPSRIVAALLGLCGLAGAIYGVVKAIWPGDLWGVLGGDDAAPGSGPMVAAVAGAVVLALAVMVLCGGADPARPAATRRRGIQP